MGRLVYIPPVKGAPKARPQLVPTLPPADLVMNCMQFVKLLKGTHEEVYSVLIKNELGTFHGTHSQWTAELDKLKAMPA